jgi:HSP20 family protein
MALFTFHDPVSHSHSLFHFPDEFSSLFEDHAPMKKYVRDTHAVATTAVDVKETPEMYKFLADLPGLKREEVKVQVEAGNVLSISGERTKAEKKDTDIFHRVERSTGKFLRRFRLPEDADISKISATCQDGVLAVDVPKLPPKEPEKPAIVNIPIN